MKKPIRIALLLIAGGMLVNWCSGQTQDSGKGLRIRALAVSLQTPLPKEAYSHALPSDGKATGVKIDIKSYLNHQFNLMAPATRKMVWTDSPDPGSVDDKEHVLASVLIPDGMSSGIFLVLPAAGSGEEKLRLLPIADSVDQFPAGSLKLMNMSPVDIRIQLEKKDYEIKSGKTLLIGEMPVSENNSAGMKAFCLNEGKWQRIGSGVWPSPGKKRVLQLFFVNPSSGQVEMRGFRDIAER